MTFETRPLAHLRVGLAIQRKNGQLAERVRAFWLRRCRLQRCKIDLLILKGDARNAQGDADRTSTAPRRKVSKLDR